MPQCWKKKLQPLLQLPAFDRDSCLDVEYSGIFSFPLLIPEPSAVCNAKCHRWQQAGENGDDAELSDDSNFLLLISAAEELDRERPSSDQETHSSDRERPSADADSVRSPDAGNLSSGSISSAARSEGCAPAARTNSGGGGNMLHASQGHEAAGGIRNGGIREAAAADSAAEWMKAGQVDGPPTPAQLPEQPRSTPELSQ